MGHIQFCLAEILVEIHEQLGANESCRALAQLKEREARGEMLESINGNQLRAYLEHQVASLKLHEAERKIIEVGKLLECDLDAVAGLARVAQTEIALTSTFENSVTGPKAGPAASSAANAEGTRVDVHCSWPARAAVGDLPTGSHRAKLRLLPETEPEHAGNTARNPNFKSMSQRLAEATAGGLTAACLAVMLAIGSIPPVGLELAAPITWVVQPAASWLGLADQE